MDKNKIANELVKLAKALIAEHGDIELATIVKNKVVQLRKPKGVTHNPNFLITSNGRDWSGFMTYDKAVQYLQKLTSQDRPNLYFYLVER